MIYFENIEENRGTLRLAVYDSHDHFLTEQVFAGYSFSVRTVGTSTAIISVPPGAYAISVYHDRNDNERLDLNFFGLPAEPVGFSNNAKGLAGPPKFPKAKFQVTQEMKSLRIRMK